MLVTVLTKSSKLKMEATSSSEAEYKALYSRKQNSS